MAVQEAGAVLKAAVEEALEVLVAETPGLDDVVYHLAAVPTFDGHVCSGEIHLSSELEWRLNLHLTFSGRFFHIHGEIPYRFCSDGDTQPMLGLLASIWEEFTFAKVMLESGVEEELAAVEQEVNGDAEGG